MPSLWLLGYCVAAAGATTWYKSHDAGGRLSRGAWTDFNKAHSGTNSIGANLDARRLSKKGDQVGLIVGWKSEGGSCKMSSEHWTTSRYQYECARHDVQEDGASSCPFCLAGTGDFRVFVGSSRVKLRTGFRLPGYKTSNRDFLGYEFRVFPHAMKEAHYYVPAKGSPRPGSSVVPTNVCFGFQDERIWPPSDEKKTSFGGYQLAYGKASHLYVELERISESEIAVAFEMGDAAARHSFTHRPSSDDRRHLPSEVNVIVINYPNERGFTKLELSDVVLVGPEGNASVVV